MHPTILFQIGIDLERSLVRNIKRRQVSVIRIERVMRRRVEE